LLQQCLKLVQREHVGSIRLRFGGHWMGFYEQAIYPHRHTGTGNNAYQRRPASGNTGALVGLLQ
jgi:hypothetical protein